MIVEGNLNTLGRFKAVNILIFKIILVILFYRSSSNLNIEIPSDESEIENDIVEDQKEGNYDPPPMKKRKLRHYSECIQNRHKKLTPLRNAVIQKWNDKTKVSSGKMASSNFSAFDQSILKQIEQIMMDKVRLINRTKIKRSNDQKNSQDIQVHRSWLTYYACFLLSPWFLTDSKVKK